MVSTNIMCYPPRAAKHFYSFSSLLLRRLCLMVVVVVALCSTPGATALTGGIRSRAFLSSPRVDDRPKLILIGGCSGTGKSTFGMSVALDQGILKCICTDTLRSVMRSFIAPDISPALHRSSYASVGDEEGDANDSPIKSWRETCTVLQHSVETLVDEMIQRGVSLVVEGVHLVPNDDLIHKWEEAGGVALGILLTVSDEEAHKQLLLRRGSMTGKGEDAKLQEFERVRVIHDEMIRLAKDDAHRWMLIEQNLEPDPLEMVASQLWNGESVECYTTEPSTTTTKSSERPTGVLWEKPQREKNNQRPTKKKITEK